MADVSVTVGDVACDVMTVTDSRLTCQTNASSSGKADVNVNIRGFGNAIRVGCKSISAHDSCNIIVTSLVIVAGCRLDKYRCNLLPLNTCLS